MPKQTFISENQIDNITEQILSKANINYSWSGCVNKINIDELIEFEFGLDIEWKDLDRYADGEIVLAAIHPKTKIIYMNETQRNLFIKKMGTMNFSKAHELGHWILHVVEQQEYSQLEFSEVDSYFCRNMSHNNFQEKQADMFAGSILMPKQIISGAIKELKGKGRVSFPQLYRLAEAFEVSISALTVRTQILKLLYIRDGKIFNSEDESLGQLSLF